jgi:hypothetical protein
MLKRLLMLLAGVLFLLAWGGCSDDDNPGDSGNPDDTLPDSVAQYWVYGLDRAVSSCEFLIIQTSADTPFVTQEMATAYDAIYRVPDGRVLLSSSMVDSTGVLVIDTIVTTTAVPGSGVYHFDPNHGYCLRVTSSKVYRLSTLWFVAVDSFSASLAHTEIDTTNRLLYGTDRTGVLPAVVYRYNYGTGIMQDSMVMSDSVGQPIEIGSLLPVPQYNRLYFLGRRINGQLRAYVYNLASRTILSSTIHESPSVRFVASSDGHTVYQSDPSESDGVCRIWYRDVASNIVRGYMTTEVTLPGGGTDNVQISGMHITPDDRYLYATGTQSRYLLVFDLSTHKLVSATTPFFLTLPPLIVLGDAVQ